MPSTYSTNLKIELQVTGENATTWGDITNTNLGTALEQAIVGYGNPSYASDANLTLTYTDTNAAQAARALVLNVTSAVSLSTTRELVVPTIQKQYIVQNNTTGSQSITVKTSAGTGITVPNGRKAHLYVDGTNVIYMDDYVDINGGAIDGTTIGANSAAAGTFTTVAATTGNITTVNATTVDTTNVEVTNIKAKDGTSAITIADSTGLVTAGAGVTLSGGNLAFSSTAQRITGDMSNATIANRLSFQTSTTNGNTNVNALPNGTSLISAFRTHNAADPTNAAFNAIQATSAEAQIVSGINGTGTYLPITFYTGGSERVRIDTSGNLALGTTNAGTAGLSLSQNFNLSWEQSSTESLANIFRQASSAATVISSGYKRTATANGFASSYGSSWAKTAISLGTVAGAITFYTDTAATTAVGTDVTPTERMRIRDDGGVGIGGTGSATRSLLVSKSMTGGTSYVGILNTGAVQSDVTSLAIGFQNTLNTAASSFTLTSYYHFATAANAFGAGSAITSQYGFHVPSTLTGATNNYGFYSDIGSGANRFNFYANGTADNYFAGNVGIGTAPSKRLHVANNSTNAEFLLSSTQNVYADFYLNTWALDRALIRAEAANPGSGSGTGSGALSFWTARNPTMTEAMRIDSSGNVGIGTASPVSKLNVLGPGAVTSFTGSTRLGFTVDGAASTNDYSGIDFTSGNGNLPRSRIASYFGGGGSYLQFGTSNNYGSGITNTALTIDPSGNVGIGTASPSGNFQVSAANSRIRFSNTAGTASTLLLGADSGQVFLGAETNAPIYFITNNTERMRIDSSGNVGIGRAPNYQLDVYRSGTTNTTVAAANDNIVNILQVSGNTAGVVGTITSHPLIFTAANTERMRIDSSGNVGIGGTADAFAKMQIAGTLPTSSNISVANYTQVTVPSGSTTNFQGYRTSISTAAASFTVSNGYHFYAAQGTLGASSAITNQFGFFADGSLTGATNNYGFYSNIASGSNRWNFYANGTAANYFAGNVGIADTGLTNVRLRVKGANTAASDYTIYSENSAATALLFVQNDGKLSTGTAANSPYNLTTASAANVYVDSSGFLYRSTSSLRYKSDVTDATHGLADVLKLRSVTYKGKDGGGTVFGGLIAEEVHDAGLTEFVAYDNEGRPDALHYGNMVALLVKAIQQLTARVATLEAK